MIATGDKVGINMNNNDYKVIESKELSKYDEKRYIIVDSNGNILDDAQGYGYKTKKNAYRCWAYKNRDKSKDKEREERRIYILKWMSEHKEFMNLFNALVFDIITGKGDPNEKVDCKFLTNLLKDNDLEIDFAPDEFLKVWEKC